MVILKSTLPIFFLVLSNLSAQSPINEPVPCHHPVLDKAQSSGLISLSAKEIPKFWVEYIKCIRTDDPKKDDLYLKQLLEDKRIRHYNESHKLSGIGTSFTVLTSLALIYSYLSLFFSP